MRQVAILVGALMVLLFVVRSHASAETLPTQISDDEFWRLATEFSEPGGSFTSENFVSNEPNFQQVLTRLRMGTKPGGAYLGVGPEQNFTYIAALQPSIAFIIDIRRQNLIQHLIYKALFELADDRADLLSMLFSRKRPDGLTEKSTPEELFNAYKSVPSNSELAKQNLQAIKDALITRHGFALSEADLETMEHVHHVFELYGPETGYGSNLRTVDFTNGGGHNGDFSTVLATVDEAGINRTFLASEENFRLIKGMERRNLIVPVVGDFGGDHALKTIAQYLRDHEVTVTVFYVSNVEQYLFQNNPIAVNGGAQKFYENVALLPIDGASTFVRTYSTRDVKQQYEGFVSALGSMLDTIETFKQKGFKSVREVLALSK